MTHRFPLRTAIAAAMALSGAALIANGHGHEGAAEGKATYASLEGKVSSGKYVMDKTHGYVTFSYNHLGFSQPQLRFRDIDAEIILNAAHPEASTIKVTIDASSIDTGVDILDQHLSGADWFDVENHPTITFESVNLTQAADKAGAVEGNLTVKGVTKVVALDVELLQAGVHPLSNKETIGVNGKATILRSDFGLSGFVPAVSDEVEIVISGEFNLVDAIKASGS